MSVCAAQPCCRHAHCGRSSSRPRRNSSAAPSRPPDGIPPAPPPPGGGDWELQYCKWSGWTWVQKDGRGFVGAASGPPPMNDYPPPSKVRVNEAAPVEPNTATTSPQQPEKKKKKRCGCFGGRRRKRSAGSPSPQPTSNPTNVQSPPTPAPTILAPPQAQRSSNSINSGRSSKSDEKGICPMCCSYVVQTPICCCCCCCCCCGDSENKPCCTVETQTCQEVKEQATKMSEMRIPKKEVPRTRCVCVRPICCCKCIRRTCCQCTRNGDCPTSNKETLTSNVNCNEQVDKETNTAARSKSKPKVCPNNCCKCSTTNENIVNYCLNSHFRRNKLDDLKLKSTNLSILQKSLDILLKNNVNIMNLFDDNKELASKLHPISSLTSTQTITSLNEKPKSDPEHGKLLTAVCDAIMASNKFDKEKYPTRIPVEKKRRHASDDLIERILDDLHFSKVDDIDLTESKEIGIQVDKEYAIPKPKKSLTKLIRNKSRVLLGARFPKKIETLRKRYEGLRVPTDKGKVSFAAKIDRRIQNDLISPPPKAPNVGRTRKEDDFDLGSIEQLLSSIDYVTSGTHCDDKDGSGASNCSFGKRGDLLECTSPPFLDHDDDDKRSNR